MYEAHGWFTLSMSTDGEGEDGIGRAVDRLRTLIRDTAWSGVASEVLMLNGTAHLVINGVLNRPRQDREFIAELLDYIIGSMPGSWGLLYERDDEAVVAPGPNAFRVTVMARGALKVRADPFFSPIVPTIED